MIPNTADGWQLYQDPTPPRLISREAVASQSALRLQAAIVETVNHAFAFGAPTSFAEAAYDRWEAAMKGWLQAQAPDGYCWGLLDTEGRGIARRSCQAIFAN